MVNKVKPIDDNFIMCYYTGPACALMVQSPSRDLWKYGRLNYGYHTGLNRETKQPINYFMVHKADVKLRPDLFKQMTEKQAVENKLFEGAVLDSLIKLGQIKASVRVKK